MKFNAIQGSLLLVRANSMTYCGRHRCHSWREPEVFAITFWCAPAGSHLQHPGADRM